MQNQHRSRRWRTLAVVAAVGVLALAGCSDKKSDGGSSSDGDSGSSTAVRISSQDFSEQKTLAQVYGQYLKDQGFDVTIQDPIGTRTQIFAALKKGSVDLVLDYQASATVELKGKGSSDADETYKTLTGLLEKDDLAAADKAEAQDANALTALKSWADENEVTKISDLADLDGPLTLGGAPECAERPDCLLGYQGTYGLKDLKFTAVDYGPPLVAALKADEIQLAQYGTTAPEISDGTIVALEDDKGLQNAENVVPIYRSSIASDKLTKALNAISAKLTTKDLAEWNQATDVDKEDPADVAQKWLEDNGFL
ncbi:ABC transporter substrate-binding protein [Aquihabitans sp. G128]|uniref:ABC transporter substrate-binding protein n=1 Tax=Aquihabitans sp. G128 TaxID=2849779 RepID=UPI001C233DB1|nr:ABC transporter substrate-binding protein [Aquihabitans sp. G128]QXC63211.1 ABC transporter substrate-binding protein [Aquihabitans sp. G128]